MMKNYKLITRLTFVVACLMMSFGAWAQLPMTRSIFNAPFVPITVGGGATTSTIVGDDGTQTAIPIGFTFNYLGTNFTTMDLCANGWASFGAGGANSWTNNNLFTATAPNNTLAPWWDDLNVGTGAVLYQTQGIAGSQTFTVQWDNVLSYNGSARTLTFKLVLYEGTNVIEFHYDSNTPGAFSVSESASIGIEGATGGAGNFIDAISGSSFINQSYMTTNKWLTNFIRFTPGAPTVLSGGTYTVGSTGTYPNLSEAVANINHRGISGPVVLSLTDAIYDTTVAGGKNIFPIMFGPVVGNNSVNTITVQPASGTATLTYRGVNSGSGGNQTNATAFGTTSEPIFAIVGTDYTTVKNINFQTIGNGLVDRALLVANATAIDGAQNNIFENISSTLLRTNTSTIAIQQNVSTTPTSPAGANSNNSYKNLTIRNTYAGIQLLGNAANPDLNTEIGTSACATFNSIGDAATPNDIGNGTTTTYGISASNQSGVKVYNNIIRNVTNTGGQADGINVVTFQGISSVYNNKIQTIRNAGAASTTTVAGIRASHATTGTHTLRVYNNSISDVTSGYTGAASATRTIKGIFISAGGGGTTQVYEIFNNNVSINGSGSLNISNVCFETTSSTGPVYNLGNNIFANYTLAQGATARHYAMFTPSATTFGPAGSTSNNNDLFIANDQGVSGFVGRGNTTDYATLANWQAGITTPAGIDATSLSIDPMFANMTTDLHANGLGLNGAGIAPPAYITNDLDCAARTPDNDIGAYILNACSGAPTAGSITGVSSVCNGSGTTLNLTGASSGAGITYQWASSTVSGGPYTNMGTSTTQATGPLTGTTYYIVTTTCAFGSSSATTQYTLNVNGLPTVTVNPTSALYCNPGTAVGLTAGGANTYTWAPSAGLSATTGTSVNATPATTTTYTVTGTDGNGCTNTATTAITSAPAVSVSSVTASPSAICTGGNSSLMANASLNLAYCTAGATSTGFEKISNVTFGTINNTSVATAGYENFTAQSTNITAGVAFPISIGISGAYATDDRIHVWVDMNNDGVFADPAENVLNLAISTFCPACAGTNTTVNGNITIPVAAYNGSTRIRIRLQDQSTGANSTPCGTSTYGQVEDYTVNISGGTTNTNISYAWSPSTFLSSTTVANPTATAMSSTTTYTVTATSLAGCSAQGNTTVTVNPLPTVTATSDDADNTVCNGTMVTLTGGGASTYTWSGGVTNATAFAATSTTTYTVTGTDVNSCQNTATLTLTVNSLPTVTASSDAPSNTACAGDMVTLTGGGATSYTWSGGVTDATAFAATSTTTYTVTGTDANSCQNIATLTLTVNSLPIVTASSDATGNIVCDGDMVTLTGGGATSYLWTGGVMDATAFTPTMTDTYTVTGTDGNGCMNTDMITITVNTLPTVTASSDAAGNMVCDGDMVTLTGGGATSYLWTGGVMDATAFTPTMTDTYTVTGTDANGCMNTDMITITVNTLPTVTASSDATNDEVCAGLMVTLNGGGADTYVWTGGVNDGASFAPSMTDTYTVTGTDLNGCEGTASITITVNALPTVDLAPFATSVCDNGGPVSLVDGTPTGGMFSGLGVTGSTFDPSVTGAGMWTITYTVTDGNGCNNSDSEVLTVDLCTGIASNESQVISLYPNPTTGMFTLNINNSNASQVVITILDMQGKVVFNESDKNVSTQYNKQIDLSDLAKGIYYVKLNIGADVKIEKLIVQ